MKTTASGLMRILMVAMIALLAGCASVPMEKTEVIQTPKVDKSVVTFVRPSIFFGDGVSFDLWDGDKYVGAMQSGAIVQYETVPGKHLFMAHGENWSYVSADLLPGKQYFIKTNLYPGVWKARVSLGAVQKDDERIHTWLTEYKAMAVKQEDAAKFESDNKSEAKAAIEEFNSGKITSFAELKPTDGR
jgi:hypothetical protein